MKKIIVCKKHKNNIGGAAVRRGVCVSCQDQTATGGGALPVLCDECSKNLQECKYCRDKMFQNLSKKETKELVNVTTPIYNLLRNKDMYLPLPSWYRAYGLDANKISSHWKKLEELLGKKTYAINGNEGRMYVWGIAWNLIENPNNKFIVYCDKRGTSLEVDIDFNQSDIFLKYFLRLLRP